ncbi:MAG: hypothetical protein NVSMB5_23250 [Candidatus Velthaea sp.]
MQLGLLEYRPPVENGEIPPKKKRRSTALGLDRGVRIRVRRSAVRASDRGAVLEIVADGQIVRYRSDKNGGTYDVDLERVAIIKRPRVPKRG